MGKNCGVSTLVGVTKCCHLSLWKVQVCALMCLFPFLTCVVIPGGSRTTLPPSRPCTLASSCRCPQPLSPSPRIALWYKLQQKPSTQWSCPHRPADPEKNKTLSLEESLTVTLFMTRGKKQICNFKRI